VAGTIEGRLGDAIGSGHDEAMYEGSEEELADDQPDHVRSYINYVRLSKGHCRLVSFEGCKGGDVSHFLQALPQLQAFKALSIRDAQAGEMHPGQNIMQGSEPQTSSTGMADNAPAVPRRGCDKCGTAIETCEQHKWKDRRQRSSRKVLLERLLAVNHVIKKKREVRYQARATRG
jgi:hypothetical protein